MLILLVQSCGGPELVRSAIRVVCTEGGVYVEGDPRAAALPLARELQKPLLVAFPEHRLHPIDQVESVKAIFEYACENVVVLATLSLTVHYALNNEILRRVRDHGLRLTPAIYAYDVTPEGLQTIPVDEDDYFIPEGPLGNVHDVLQQEISALWPKVLNAEPETK